MIGQTISHYRVLEKLGQGGMGVVYLAEDTRLGRRVALKALAPEFARDPQRRKRFQQEARAAASITHPGIAAVYEMEEVGEELYIVYEYVRGESLRTLVKSGGLGLDTLLDIATDIARALAAAHELGVVHRDLKPENIQRTPAGDTKILDFGLARFQPAALDDATRSVGLTEAGTILGTIAYMSPEQLESKATDFRSDIFSFGVLLYELAAGAHPFEGASAASTISRIMTAEPAPVIQRNPIAPPELDRIVRKCLRKRREERYQSTRDLAVDLESLKRDSAGRPTTAATAVGATLPAARPHEPELVQHEARVWGLTPRRWWEFDTLAGLLIFYPLMTYLVWKGVDSFVTKPEHKLGVFVYALAWIVAPFSLRVYLLSTAAFHPASLPREVQRMAPWLRFTHLLLLFGLVIAAGVFVESQPGLAGVLVGLAVMGGVAVLIIHPAINRAAFPEIMAAAPAPAGRIECRRIAWIQAIYLGPFGFLMVGAPVSLAVVIGRQRRWDEVLVIPTALIEVMYRTGRAEEAALVWMALMWAVVLGFGILMGKNMLGLWDGKHESAGAFYRRFPVFLLGDLLAVASMVWLLTEARLIIVAFLALPALLYLPFYQRSLARKVLGK